MTESKTLHLISVLEDRSSKRNKIMDSIVATLPPMSDIRYKQFGSWRDYFLLLEFKKERISGKEAI